MTETVTVVLSKFHRKCWSNGEVRQHLRDNGMDPRTAHATELSDGSGDVEYRGERLPRVVE